MQTQTQTQTPNPTLDPAAFVAAMQTDAARIAFVRRFACDAALAASGCRPEYSDKAEQISRQWRAVVAICDGLFPPDYRGAAALWPALPASVLFKDLPRAEAAFAVEPLDASWGDNAASLVWGDLIYTALHNAKEANSDPATTKEIETAQNRLDAMPPHVFIDLEA